MGGVSLYMSARGMECGHVDVPGKTREYAMWRFAQHKRQVDVAKDIAGQIAGGSRQVFGVMVESHIHEGAQKFTPGKDDVNALEFGKSITDACIGWDDSELVLQTLSDAVKARRSR